ncbi:MAG: ABC transporter permease [Actinomycetota bacterium]
MAEFVASMLRSGVPIALAGVGVLFAVRAGIFHLGLEGLMLSSAFVAVAVGRGTDSIWLAVGGALLASAILSVLYWWLIEHLGADAVIAGLGLTTLSVGGTAFFLDVIFDVRGRIDSRVALPRPVRGADDGIGAYVTELSILGWLTIPLVVVAWVVLRRTRFGLRLSAVGSFSYGARAAGVDEPRVRLAAMLCASVGAALAGVEIALGGLSAFSENMTAGRGFIALAAALFGLLHPFGTGLAALFFGSAAAIGVVTQINSIDSVPRPFILMIPFLVTIAAVSFSSIARRRAIERRSRAGLA